MLKLVKYFLLGILSIFLIMVILVAYVVHVPNPYYLSQSFSPNRKYSVKLYTLTSDEKEGTSVYIDVHDENGKKIRKKIYQQWYCVNAEIEWLSNERIIINNNELNIVTDSIYFEKKEGQFCPSK